MKEIYLKFMAEHLSVRQWQVENCVALFDEGDTIPFISRYRKEKTGGLDDLEVAEVRHWTDVFTDMEKRKAGILETIAAAGKLTDELRDKIENCVSSSELEDLYLPFRPKRRTRATIAKEAGLESLADSMCGMRLQDPLKEAGKYLNDKVATAEDALAGARDIVAERDAAGQGMPEAGLQDEASGHKGHQEGLGARSAEVQVLSGLFRTAFKDGAAPPARHTQG